VYIVAVHLFARIQ